MILPPLVLVVATLLGGPSPKTEPPEMAVASLSGYRVDLLTSVVLDGVPASIREVPKGCTIKALEVVHGRVARIVFETKKP